MLLATLVFLAASLMVGLNLTSGPAAVADGPPLVVRVGHVDPDNQQPEENRLFSYTDFFSRNVRVHQGDTIVFQYQPFTFNIVALAADEDVARDVYPVVLPDDNDDGTGTAPGTGLPKVVYGPSNFPINNGSTSGGGDIFTDRGKGPPVCGVAARGQEPCEFRGGDHIEVIGPAPGFSDTGPATVDQAVTITAPPGTYTYFDPLHPGMRGTLEVVPPSEPASTQEEIDADSARQFEASRQQALAVEEVLNGLGTNLGGGGPEDLDTAAARDLDPALQDLLASVAADVPAAAERSGRRHHLIFNGAGAADNHVEIDEFLPNRPVEVAPGDLVSWMWADPQAIHNVAFPVDDPRLPEPVGYDCGEDFVGIPGDFNVPPPPPPDGCVAPGEEPQFVADPGITPAGTALTDPTALVNSGMLVGRDFDLEPSTQHWWVRISEDAAPGSYPFLCTLHPWMQGELVVE